MTPRMFDFTYQTLFGIVHNIFREKNWLSFEATVHFDVKKRKADGFFLSFYFKIVLPP